MALSPTEIGAIVTACIGVAGAIVVPIWVGRQNAQAATDTALTARFSALIDRQTAEREHLERQILKMETVTADLEVMVIKLTAWRDDVIVLMKMRGIVDFPEPPKFN